MDDFKDFLKNWLTENEKDRFWLADKCGVSKKTIDKWFEKIGIIPPRKIDLIKSLLQENKGNYSKRKDQIKDWLKEMDRDRFWLAKKCGVSKRTVDDWISTSREIPAKALLQIQDLMEKDDEVPESNQKNYTVKNGLVAVAVIMTVEEHSFLSSMAQLEDKTVDEFIKDAGLEEAEKMNTSIIDQISELQEETPQSPSSSRQNTPTIIRGLDRSEETSA